jgi:Ca2+/Na+ antiporter
VLELEIVVRIRLMPQRAITITARVAFVCCGVISLFTAVPYVMLKGIQLPVQSEWVIFAAALTLVGVFSITAAVLPRSWIAKACRQVQDKDRSDERLFLGPLKLLGSLAAIFYLVAVFAYFAPSIWNLNPQVMFALCPMYFLKMNFDPSPLMIFFLLAPLNAGVYGALGVGLGYARLAFGKRTSSQTV